MSCSVAWADVTIVEGPTELPFEGVTPAGLVDLWLYGDSDPPLINSEFSGFIGYSSVSGSATSGGSSLDGEVGLWYAEGNVIRGTNATFGRSTVIGFAHFTIDGSQLSIQWDFNATTDQDTPGAPLWVAVLQDGVTGDFLGWYSQTYPAEDMDILDLIPDHVYTLYWGVDVGVWDDYGTSSHAILTLDLTDLGGSSGGGYEKIVETIVFFDESVDAGGLEGQGPAQSADKRLNALRNMLENAAILIEGGFYSEACEQLWAAYGKCDGDPLPPDLVTGTAIGDLAFKIQEVINELGCE